MLVRRSWGGVCVSQKIMGGVCVSQKIMGGGMC